MCPPAGEATGRKDIVGAPVPLTGRYAVQGVQMRAGLELWAAHAGRELLLPDDESLPERAAELHAELLGRSRFVLGPYGSDSTRAVAATAPTVLWNHGAAADDVQRLPGVVSLPSPASRYLVALGRVVAELRPRARVSVLAAPGSFARLARDGLAAEAKSLGLELVDEDADAVLACGPLAWELDVLRPLVGAAVLRGGVSPGLADFPELLGSDPDGFLAPVQWHPDLGGPPALRDYIAAQAYAVALIAERCLELDPKDPLAAARALRTQTFFGDFELDPDTGLQIGHRLSVVRWRGGRQELLLADAA